MKEFLLDYYIWLKAFHLIAVIAWMAGMLYLPRLFVYHCQTAPGSEGSDRFKVMERKLLKGIINPSMGAVWLLGLTLAWITEAYTQPWFLGVVCLRGDLYGLSDLARLIGSDAAQSSRFPASGTEAQLVTLNPALDAQCALRIDRLAGLRGLDAFKASAPAPEGSPGWFGSVYHDASNARWQEINLQSLSQQPRFLRIGV